MAKGLYSKVYNINSLFSAWRVVHGNGVSSKSEKTRRDIRIFELDAEKRIRRIQRQLSTRKFQFLPSEGILQPKPGKSSRRPIVRSPIENRIVQRSILDVLQSHPPLTPYFSVKTSFGGIKDRGVSDALRVVYGAIQDGAKYFLRSDIDSFFTKIPKSTVMSIISNTTTDAEFLGLLNSAITVELSNLEELGTKKDEFPIYEIGVAQGSCLSPLLGNILLNEFDQEMNKSDISCIRYIDDFIIVAPNQKALNAAFKRARRLLAKHGLNVYDPKSDHDKAETGKTTSMFSFLGCDIRPGMIRPDKKSQSRLLNNVDELFKYGISLMHDPPQLVRNRCSTVETLSDVSNIVKGWGNQYSFCNDISLMRSIDSKIDKKIGRYLAAYAEAKTHFDEKSAAEDRRRILGVHLLVDSKKNPIITG